MLSISIIAIIMISSGNVISNPPVNFEYAHQVIAEDGLDRTVWLSEVVVTAEPIKASPENDRPVGLLGAVPDQTYWLSEIVVTAEPITASTGYEPLTSRPDGRTDNTYWLPEVVVTAEPIRGSQPINASPAARPAANRFASAVVAGALALFSTLLGFGLLARPEMPAGPRLQPYRVKPVKQCRRRRVARRLAVSR